MASLPGLHLRRSLGLRRKTILVDQFVPKDHKDGLLFAVPGRRRAETVYNAGARGVVAPSAQVVDALGSYIHSVNGIITPAQANVLRIGGGIDLDSRRLGIFLEGLRENTCLQSEAMNLSPWTNQGAPVAINDITAPDAALTADKLVENSSTSAHGVSQTISITSGQKQAVSVFVKKGERTDFILWVQGAPVPNSGDVNVWFDVNTGVRGTVSAGIDDSGIDNLGNSWYRCWLVFTAVSSGATNYILRMGDGEVSVYLGDGSSGLYLWGAMCEEDVPFPGSYIKTEASATTRAADDLRYDNTSQVNVKAAEGTFYLAYSSEGEPGDNNRLISLLKVSPTNGWRIYSNLSGEGLFQFFSDGTTIGLLNLGQIETRGATFVICVVWKENDYRVYLDGVEKANLASGAAPADINATIYIGQTNDQISQSFANMAHLHGYDSAHSAARVLRNTREIQAWLGI